MLKGTLCNVRHVQAADLNAYISLVNDLPSRGEFFSMQFKSPEAMGRIARFLEGYRKRHGRG